MSPIRLCTNQLASNFRMWKSMRRCCKSRNQLVTEHYCRFQWTDAIWESLPHVRRILSPARIHFTQSGPCSECRTLARIIRKDVQHREIINNNCRICYRGFVRMDSRVCRTAIAVLRVQTMPHRLVRVERAFAEEEHRAVLAISAANLALLIPVHLCHSINGRFKWKIMQLLISIRDGFSSYTRNLETRLHALLW